MRRHRDCPSGCTERPETIAAASTTLQQLQRDRRIEQNQRCVGRQRHTRRQLCRTERAIRQLVEQLQTDTREQNLRINKAGAEIEQRACTPPRDRPRQRKTPSKTLKSWIGEYRIAPASTRSCKDNREMQRTAWMASAPRGASDVPSPASRCVIAAMVAMQRTGQAWPAPGAGLPRA